MAKTRRALNQRADAEETLRRGRATEIPGVRVVRIESVTVRHQEGNSIHKEDSKIS